MKNILLTLMVFGSFEAFAENEIESYLLSLKCTVESQEKITGAGNYFLIDVYLLEDFSFQKNDEEWKASPVKAKTILHYERWDGYIFSTTLSNKGLKDSRTLDIHPEYFAIYNGAHTISFDRNDQDNPDDDQFIHESNHGPGDFHQININRVTLEVDIWRHTHPDKTGPYMFEYSTNGVDNVFSRFGYRDQMHTYPCVQTKEGAAIKFLSETNSRLDKQKLEKEKQRREKVLRDRRLDE